MGRSGPWVRGNRWGLVPRPPPSGTIVESVGPAAGLARTNPASTSVRGAAKSSGVTGAHATRRSRTPARLNLASSTSPNQQDEPPRRWTFRKPETASDVRTSIDRRRTPRSWGYGGRRRLRELWGYFLNRTPQPRQPDSARSGAPGRDRRVTGAGPGRPVQAFPGEFEARLLGGRQGLQKLQEPGASIRVPLPGSPFLSGPHQGFAGSRLRPVRL
jgi:hypothetical protein